MSIIAFYIQPYYDSLNKQYFNIITVNTIPNGPLSNYIKNLQFKNLSPFSKNNTTCSNFCLYAIKNINNNNNNNFSYNEFLCYDNIDNLIEFLLLNNYTIDKNLTKIMNNDKIYLNNGKKLLFYVKYNL